MSAETEQAVRFEDSNTWLAGAAGGLLAGAVMGVLLQTMMTPVIENAIPALYGLSGAAAGWGLHLFHSVVFGLVYAAVAATDPLRGYADGVTSGAGLGVAYGVAIWVVAAGIVMPIWLGAVGFPEAPPLPNFDPMSLVGHVVFGLVLGAAYPLVLARR